MGRLRTKTLNKLASISALGAGALALAPDSAEASVLAYNGAPITLQYTTTIGGGTPNQPAVWPANLISSHVLPLPGLLGFGLFQCGCGEGYGLAVGYSLWFQTTRLRTISNNRSTYFLRLANFGDLPSGRGWSGVYGIATFAQSSGGNLLSGGNGQFAHKFALFSFLNGSQSATDFGWAELSMSAVGNPDGTVTETLTIENYAYDDAGAMLPAGEMTAVPEPGTMRSMALGALALGAVGLRRWRSARRKSA
jgi:hypothetical protein